MKRFLIGWIIYTVAVLVAAHVVTGIRYDSVGGLIVASLLLGILNSLVRPLLLLLSLPLVVVTLGLFTLVINALLLLSVGWLVDSFTVANFWSAFWGGLVISVISWILNALLGTDSNGRGGGSAKSRARREGPVIDV